MSKTKEELETEQKKVQEELAKKKKEEEDAKKKDDLDPKIAEMMKDPDAVANLLKAKRDANEEAKQYRLKLEAFEKAKQDADAKALADQGKFKELAEKEKSEKETMKLGFMKKLIDLALTNEAIKQGSIDAEAVVALADRKALKISDNFETVEGVEDTIAVLKKNKAYLFNDMTDSKRKFAPNPNLTSLRGIGDKVDDSARGVDRIAAGLAIKKK